MWLSRAELEKKQMAELRRQQMIDAGLIPNIATDTNEDGEEKKGSVVARKRKQKKDKVQEEGKQEVQEQA